MEPLWETTCLVMPLVDKDLKPLAEVSLNKRVSLNTLFFCKFKDASFGREGWRRLREAAFAQTPKSGFTPAAGAGWYDASHLAQSRARAHYVYDDAGRLTEVSHWWDKLETNNAYTSEAILTNSCLYELTGLNRGLKTASGTSYRSNPGGAWTLLRTSTYGYDPNLDQLTSETVGGSTVS